MLQAFESVERTVGLYAHERDLRVQLLQAPPGPHHRARSAEAGDEMGHPALGLPPDLLRRRQVMRAGVRRMVVLIRIPVLVRPQGGEPPRLPNGAIRAFQRIGENDFRAVRVEQRLALLARVPGHAHRHADAGRGAQHRVRDRRVAARRVEQALGRQFPPRDPVPQDEQRGAVLHRAARVEPFGLEKGGR